MPCAQTNMRGRTVNGGGAPGGLDWQLSVVDFERRGENPGVANQPRFARAISAGSVDAATPPKCEAE